MENEYQILTHLQENELTTQRKISKRTGLSLGAVNILIKKMVRKGLVKVEKLNARTVRYILTPQGMKEKTKLTYQFIRHSYNRILSITNAVEELLQEEMSANGIKRVILYGPADEVEQILKSALSGSSMKTEVIRPGEEGFKPSESDLVLTWRSEDEESLPAKSGAVNIMNMV